MAVTDGFWAWPLEVWHPVCVRVCVRTWWRKQGVRDHIQGDQEWPVIRMVCWGGVKNVELLKWVKKNQWIVKLLPSNQDVMVQQGYSVLLKYSWMCCMCSLVLFVFLFLGCRMVLEERWDDNNPWLDSLARKNDARNRSHFLSNRLKMLDFTVISFFAFWDRGLFFSGLVYSLMLRQSRHYINMLSVQFSGLCIYPMIWLIICAVMLRKMIWLFTMYQYARVSEGLQRE